MGRPGTSPPSLHKGGHSVTIETKHRHDCSCPHSATSVSSEAPEQMASCEQGKEGLVKCCM